MVKLSDYVIRFISGLGVKHVFMFPGGGCMHLIDSLGRCSDIQYVCNLHEQAAAFAAEAYGEYSNEMGVVLVTTGPGGTNAVTGVAAAWVDSTPCMIISGQVKRSDLIGNSGVRQMGFQEVDIVSIVKPITKYAVTVMEPASIKFHMEKAVYLAKNGRPGPVWIDIPLDVQGSMIDEFNLPGFAPGELESAADNGLLERQVAETISLLNQSERPAILAGNGIRLSGAEALFSELIEILGVPVLTTWKAIDLLPENHSLFIGRPGSIGQRGANFTQQNSDCLLILGARLDFGQIGFNYSNFAWAAKKVMVDIDPAELKKMKVKIDIPVSSDVKKFIEEFMLQADKIKAKDRSDWIACCRDWKKRYPVVLPEYWEQEEQVNPYVLVEVLSEEMTAQDVLVPGSSGACSEMTMQAFKVKKGQRVLNNQGFGAMGSGLPASIGACFASGLKRTVSIIGDGGFQLNIQELETVARYNLPIKYFILNNKGYGSIRTMQRSHFDGHYVASSISSGLTLPDTGRIARAYGISSMQLSSHKELRNQVREALQLPGPVICDVLIPEDFQTAPRVTSVRMPDGTMVSRPLEDLWPSLDRNELAANMIIQPPG